MDAETRHTLAATVPSMLVRVSFVFLALREHDRENGASVQKTNKKLEREREREEVEEKEKNQIVSMLSISVKRNDPRNIRKSS